MFTEQIEYTTLPNGIGVGTETMPQSNSISLGIWVRSGPRHETPDRNGISHFVEHMLFKGTSSRSARQINESLYPVGGHLNAFTDREFTCYTALVLRENLGLAIEVISDMMLHSLFAPDELSREKRVILEEIKAIEDTPEDLVHDILTSTIWPDHPLGQPVIGRKETVSHFAREEVLAYVASRYSPGNILVSAAGDLDHREVVAEIEQRFGAMPAREVTVDDLSPVPHAQSSLLFRRTKQAHLCMGMPAFRQQDHDNYPLIFLDTVLGSGPHSRLFDEVRENRGLAYAVGSSVSAFAEGGLFTIYASTSRRSLDQVVQIIREQLDKVVQEGLSEDELDQARRHIRASLLLSHESTGSRMGRLANAFLYFGRFIPFAEVMEQLERVTAGDVLRVARAVLRPELAAMAIIGPVDPVGRQAERLKAA